MEVNEITLDSYGWFFRRICTVNEKTLKVIAKDIHKEILRLKDMIEEALRPFMKIVKMKRSLASCRLVALGLDDHVVANRAARL